MIKVKGKIFGKVTLDYQDAIEKICDHAKVSFGYNLDSESLAKIDLACDILRNSYSNFFLKDNPFNMPSLLEVDGYVSEDGVFVDEVLLVEKALAMFLGGNNRRYVALENDKGERGVFQFYGVASNEGKELRYNLIREGEEAVLVYKSLITVEEAIRNAYKARKKIEDESLEDNIYKVFKK